MLAGDALGRALRRLDLGTKGVALRRPALSAHESTWQRPLRAYLIASDHPDVRSTSLGVRPPETSCCQPLAIAPLLKEDVAPSR